MASQDGGPAFPVPTLNTEMARQDGMTLRDYFAGQALTGILAYFSDLSNAAERAYKAADAMLEVRKNGPAKK